MKLVVPEVVEPELIKDETASVELDPPVERASFTQRLVCRAKGCGSVGFKTVGELAGHLIDDHGKSGSEVQPYLDKFNAKN